MKSKIRWYREVLELEPQSKVFFPLAQLLIDNDELEEALKTLQHGLTRNPEHVEAKLLQAEVLQRLGKDGELASLVQNVSDSMAEYPAFWETWARLMDAEEDGRDTAMALRFLAAWFAGQKLSWAQIIQTGLQTLLDQDEPLPPVPDALRQAAAMAKRSELLDEDDDFDEDEEEDEQPQDDLADDLASDANKAGEAASVEKESSVDESFETAPDNGFLTASEDDSEQAAAEDADQEAEDAQAGETGAQKSAGPAAVFAPESFAASQDDGVTPQGPVSEESLRSFEQALSETDFDTQELEGPAAQAEDHCEEQTGASSEQAPERAFAEFDEDDAEEDEDEGEEETFSLRTRTMADLLAEQGDYEGALDIYRELAAVTPEGEGRQELESLVDDMRRLAGAKSGGGNSGKGRKGAALQKQTSKGLKDKTKLISALESLAQRLEAKAAH